MFRKGLIALNLALVLCWIGMLCEIFLFGHSIFTLEATDVAIIGGADGPTSVFTTNSISIFSAIILLMIPLLLIFNSIYLWKKR